MADERVLTITDPKDRALIRFSAGVTFDASVNILEAALPQSQSTCPYVRNIGGDCG